MPLVACCSVKLRFPKQCVGCHASSIYQSAKHIATWKRPPISIDQSKFPKPRCRLR